ncbi:hypothetical protein Taro_005460 [Colocasia esculenta]|uniref:Pentatricopeptide repeat-containing protein n=1 Tax=Colocasia esculenta TaxID=4460 RepID=A0A843TUJ4_COLES|nr:hypothetical protein [Colocasia esculenta]
MRRAGTLLLDFDTLPSVLKACAGDACLKRGAALHARVVKGGFGVCTSVANSMISLYSRCGVVDSSWNVFNHMPKRDSVSWNAMIHGLLFHGAHEDGLVLFMDARAARFEPNVATLVLVLRACWRNSLLSNYAKSHDMDSAHRLFDEICERDVVSWSVMLGGYAQGGEAEAALRLFRTMYRTGGKVEPDGLTLVSVLQACSSLEDGKPGRMMHAYVVHRGFHCDVFIGNSLVDMYSKCSDVESAHQTFREMPQRNIVSWNSMLSGLVYNERYLEALALFDSMKTVGVMADEVTLVNLLQSCRNLEQAVWCKCIHGMVTRRSFESNVVVVNMMLDAYAKCDLVNLATRLFQLMDNRNMITWSTMIMGYAYCGMPDEAISLFGEMLFANIKPSSVTMLNVLQACSTLQDIKLSRSVHGIAVRNALAKEVTVGTALLNTYAKCGEINLSSKVFGELPEKNVISWSAMVHAYGMNGHAKEALALLHKMKVEKVEPNKVTVLSLLSACSHGGLVEEGVSCFKDMFDDYSLEPSPEHYSCMVDMLGRAGDLSGALEVINKMSEGIEVGASAWGALLSACRNFGNWQLGEQALSHVMKLEQTKASGYLLASNMYAMDGLRSHVARMRLMMREKHVKIVAGCSSVHVDRKVHKFVAGDESHLFSEAIHSAVEHLHLCMQSGEKDCILTVCG